MKFSWMTDPFVGTLASGMQMFILNPFSPALLRGWTRSVDGRMKKNGWVRNSPHICGPTPERC